MKKILAFLRHEFREMLPPTLYFFVVFHILIVARNFMAEEWGISAVSSSLATIGALVVGKAILLTDALPFVKGLAPKRLVYDIAFRTIFYTLITLVLQFLEEFIPAFFRQGGIGAAFEHVFSEIHWPKFWVTHLFLVVFLAFYVTATAVMRAVGHDTIKNLLLSPKRAAAPPLP